MKGKDWRADLANKVAAKKQEKKFESKADELKKKNVIAMAKTDPNAIPGAGKYLGLINVGGANYPTYADSHQGKHIDGFWEDGPKQEGACFYSTVASWTSAAVLFQIAQNVPWNTVINALGGGDFRMQCSIGIGLSDDAEVDCVWVQGGFQTRYGIKHISFHAIPVTKAEADSSGWTLCPTLTIT